MKNHLRQLICAVITLSIFSSYIIVAAKEDVKVYGYESFEEFTTNDAQEYFDVGGNSDVIVAETGKMNKALMINKRALYSSELTRTFDPIAGDVVFQFDIKIEGERFPWSLAIKSANGKTMTPVKEDDTGALLTSEGKRYGRIGSNKWVNIAVLYSPSIERYSIYLDRKYKLSDWILTDRTFDMPQSISISMDATENGDSKIYLDNFKIYSGTELQKDSLFVKKGYNKKSVKYQETIISQTDNILQVVDFSSKVGYPQPKGNIIETRQENDNSYLHLEETNTSDCFIDFISGLGSQYYTVYSIDIRSSKYCGSISLFNFKLKPDNAFCEMLSVKSGGTLTAHNGKVLAKLSKNKWQNVSLVVDFLKKKFDVYLDYEIIGENIPLKNQNGTFPSNLRFQLSGKTNNNLDIDNLVVYYGKEVKRVVDESTLTGFSSDVLPTYFWDLDTKAKEQIGENVAYDAISSNTYYGGEKTIGDPDGAFIENEVNYLPILKTAEKLNKEVTVEGEKYIYNDVTVEVNSSIMTVGADKVTLPAPVTQKNGTAYAPCEAFSVNGMLGKEVFSDSRGFVLFGNDTLSSEAERELVNFMHFERPSKEQLLADYNAPGIANVHPRVLMDKNEFERLKNTINTNAEAKEMYEKVKAKYENLDFRPMTYVLANGERLLPVSDEVYTRVLALSLLYRVSGETKYAERAYKEMEAVANFPDWHPIHFLDTAKMAQAVSIGYDWTYDYLSDEQREVVEKALVKFGIREYLRRYTMKEWWADDEANWAAICNGGAITTALALMDKYPEECSQMLEIAIKGFENVSYSFGPDGAYHEGLGYWEATLEGLELALQSLKTSLNKDYGIATSSGLDKTIDWARAISYTDKNFGYSDGSGTEVSLKVKNAMWLGYYYSKPEWQVLRTEAVEQGFSGEFLYELYDLMWYVPEYINSKSKNSISLDSKYRDVEVGSTRSSFSDGALALMYKGGTAKGKGHEHMDAGTFSLFQDGIGWANDYGYDNYNSKGYYEFTDKSKPNRWSFYRTSTQGHNCIVINPDEDSAINPQDWMAMSKIVRFESKDKGSIGVLDLSEAYAHKASHYTRGFMLADDRRSAIIRDEMVIPGSNNEIYWFMHTGISGDENFEINGNSMVITHPSGEKLYLEFTTNAAKAEIFTMDSEFLPSFKNPGADMWAVEGKKVAIKLIGGGAVNLTVKIYDNDLCGMLPKVEDTPISQWTIPDGELKTAPTVDGIYKDGAIIDNFNSNLREYNLEIYYDKEFPQITVAAPYGAHVDSVQIPIDDDNIEYKIRVTSDDDAGFFSNYSVKIKKVPYTYKTFDDYIRLYPSDITASRVPEAHNPPESVDDNNFETRFAVDGDNEWVQLDYGKVVEADAFAVAYYKGTERISYYDILISEDGVNYTTIYEGQTSGLTNDFELYKTGRIKLRYLKLVGHKSSAGDWNSPTEIALLALKGE